MKRITAVVMGCILLTANAIFAQTAPMSAAVAQPVEVGNKHCPVSGREVGVMGPAYKYTYNGKVYNLCCAGCPKTFASNPAKYTKIAQDDALASTQAK